jgi:hypothetical protein
MSVQKTGFRPTHNLKEHKTKFERAPHCNTIRSVLTDAVGKKWWRRQL